jgi:hypothetical protein
VADSDEPSADPGALSDAYERLRAAVLAGAAGGWRLGHGVLSARGTVAWISAVGELAPPVGGTTGAAPGSEAPGSAGRGRPASPAVALPHADQVVQVLTQMVLPLAA